MAWKRLVSASCGFNCGKPFDFATLVQHRFASQGEKKACKQKAGGCRPREIDVGECRVYTVLIIEACGVPSAQIPTGPSTAS